RLPKIVACRLVSHEHRRRRCDVSVLERAKLIQNSVDQLHERWTVCVTSEEAATTKTAAQRWRAATKGVELRDVFPNRLRGVARGIVCRHRAKLRSRRVRQQKCVPRDSLQRVQLPDQRILGLERRET